MFNATLSQSSSNNLSDSLTIRGLKPFTCTPHFRKVGADGGED